MSLPIDVGLGLGIDEPAIAALGLLSFSDFKNGIYTLNGQAKTLGDLWITDASWGAFNPVTDVVPGVGLDTGLTNTARGVNPTSSPALTNGAHIPFGATIVAEYSTFQSVAGGFNVGFTLNPVDLPGYLVDVTWSDFQNINQLGVWPTPGNFIPATFTPAPDGVKKVAFSYTSIPDPGHLGLNSAAYSVNGAPVVTTNHASGALLAGCPLNISVFSTLGTGAGNYRAICTKLSIYNLTMDPTVLRALAS